MLSTLKDKVAPRHTALVVIDLQNDGCEPEGVFGRKASSYALEAARAATDRVLKLIDSARARGVAVVYVRSSHGEWTESEVLREMRLRWGSDRWCLEGTWGAEFYRLSPLPGEHVVRKHRYSAFFGTDLDVALRAKGMRTILLAGTMSDVCVETTARDAFMRDYYVVALDDCCCTTTKEAHDAAMQRIAGIAGVVASSDEVTGIWQNFS